MTLKQARANNLVSINRLILDLATPISNITASKQKLSGRLIKTLRATGPQAQSSISAAFKLLQALTVSLQIIDIHK